VKTDERGQFEVELATSGNVLCSVSSDEVIEPAGKEMYYSSGCFTIKAGIDTTYTLYLQELTTATIPVRTDAKHLFTVSAIQGKGIHLQIPEWKGQKITASIISSSGQRVTSLGSNADGTLFWDTRSVTRGVYFLQLKNDNRNLSMKLLVK
jgi:hypothetical protein